jgi:MFS family permease
MWLALSRFAIYFGYSTFLDWVNDYTEVNLDTQAWLNDIGMPGMPAGLVLPAMMLFFLVGGIGGSMLSPRFSERYGKKAMIAAGATTAIAFFVPLIVTSSVWIAIGSGMLLGAGWGAFLAADWAFACSLMPKGMTGSFMSMWTITGLLPQTLGPIISGPLRDFVYNGWKGNLGEHRAEALAYQVIFSLIIVYFMVGLVLLRNVREQRRPTAA